MTLRDDIRAGFDRKQATLGEVSDARHRLMHDALAAHENVSHRAQWVAGIAAVLIAALVIATFALVRGNIRPHVVPATSPRANASPTPLRTAINVPDSTPLILYHDPATFDQLDGMTWDGKMSGRVGTGATNGGLANPQGTLFATGNSIVNRAGQPLANVDPKNQQVFWADDGAHFCSLNRVAPRDTSSVGVLTYGSPGQPSRRVGEVGTLYPASSNGGGPSVIACSPAADRVVVYQSGGQGLGVVNFWVLRLSTGELIWKGGVGWEWIAASHDGLRIALTNTQGTTTIFGDAGESLATLDAWVFAFSWDGKLAVTAGRSSAPDIVDWQTGQTIWSCPSSTFKYWEAFPEPDGSHLAIGVLDPQYPQTGGFAPVDLFVVGPDGVTVFERQNITLFS